MTNPILVTNYLKLRAARILALVIGRWYIGLAIHLPQQLILKIFYCVQSEQNPTFTLTMYVSPQWLAGSENKSN